MNDMYGDEGRLVVIGYINDLGLIYIDFVFCNDKVYYDK